MNNRFYVNTAKDGYDEKSYARAFLFADEIAQRDSEVNRIVLYIHSKNNTGYFDRFFDGRTIKLLLDGTVQLKGFQVPFTIETVITYSNCKHSSSGNDLVLAFGMDLEDLEVLDDYSCVKYIVAIPWIKDKTMPWVRRWGAIEISDTSSSESVSPFSNLSDITKVALKELTSTINLSTGISNSFDNERAKTYVRALHRFEQPLIASDVVSYLTTELGWSTSHAKDVGRLITTLNEGRSFKGGDKTGLNALYNRWKISAKNP